MSDYSLNWTARSSAIQGYKGINDAARPPEGSPAEVGGLADSSLPLLNRGPLANQWTGGRADICYCLPPDRA